MSSRWFTDMYREAVWESEDLKGLEKAVAETYTRYARDDRNNKSATADLAWLTWEQLMKKAGIGSRNTVRSLLTSLETKGWLTVVERVSHRPTTYRLTIPLTVPGSTKSETTDAEPGSTKSGTTVVHLPSSATAGSTKSGTSVVPKVGLHHSFEVQKKPLSQHAQPPTLVLVEPRESSSTTTKPEGPSSAQRALATAHVTGADAERVIAWADETQNPVGEFKGGGWWRRVIAENDVARLVAAYRKVEAGRRQNEPCPQHGLDDPKNRRRGGCDGCDELYGIRNLFGQLLNLDPARAGAYLPCPEHAPIGSRRHESNDIGTCDECKTAHDDNRYWMTHPYDGPPAQQYR